MQTIDRDWFQKKLDAKGRSLRALARHLDIDPSAASRMLAGTRRMKMEEVDKIALFLGAPVSEVIQHAGMSRDLDGQPTRILLAATIDDKGTLNRMTDPRPLPQAVIDRAQSAIGDRNGKVIAAQVRAATGCLAVLDDAVVLFGTSEGVDPAAIGTLAICRTKDGAQFFGRVTRARKTGEASFQNAAGKEAEVILVTATPVIAIIP